MAVQPGASAKVIGGKEGAYGTAVSTGLTLLPFFNFGLAAEQPLITPTVLGVSPNRDPGDPVKDVVTVAGDVEVPIDANNLGYWLNMLLGAPTTTGTATATHVFRSGGTALPSYTLEQQHAQVPNYGLVTGAMASGMSINFRPSGELRARMSMVGQGQTNATTAVGTSTSRTYTPFGAFQLSVLRDGAALALAAEATLNFSNALEPIRTIRSDGKVDGFIPGITNISGDLTVYFSDTTLLTQAANGTSCSLALRAGTSTAAQYLEVLIGRLYLPVPKIVTPGPQGIRAVFSFQGAYNAGDTAMVKATLINQVAAY